MMCKLCLQNDMYAMMSSVHCEASVHVSCYMHALLSILADYEIYTNRTHKSNLSLTKIMHITD